jgi:hypothetical protein
MAEDIIIIHIPWSVVVTELFQLMFMFPDAHPLQRRLWLVYFNCKRKLKGPTQSHDE